MFKIAWIAAAAAVAAGLGPVAPGRAVAAQSAASGGVASAVCSASGCPEVKRCWNWHLTASYKRGDSAAGHAYGWIRLTNTSGKACVIRGYGGLSYVGDGDGTQIGAAADRTPGKRPTRILYPGDRVRSQVGETSAGAYSDEECDPAGVDGFRVYAPGAKKSQYVPHPTTGCRNKDVHLLEHKAYR
jgi:hypothetical protein